MRRALTALALSLLISLPHSANAKEQQPTCNVEDSYLVDDYDKLEDFDDRFSKLCISTVVLAAALVIGIHGMAMADNFVRDMSPK